MNYTHDMFIGFEKAYSRRAKSECLSCGHNNSSAAYQGDFLRYASISDEGRLYALQLRDLFVSQLNFLHPNLK